MERATRAVALESRIHKKMRGVRPRIRIFGWKMGLATPLAKLAALYAHPSRSPRGHLQKSQCSMNLQNPFCLDGRCLSKLNAALQTKKPLLCRGSSSIGSCWVEDGIRTHDLRNHISTTLSTSCNSNQKVHFKKGYKYVHNFCCLNKDRQKYVNDKTADD